MQAPPDYSSKPSGAGEPPSTPPGMYRASDGNFYPAHLKPQGWQEQQGGQQHDILGPTPPQMTHSNSNWSGGGTGYPPNQMQNPNQFPQQQMPYQNQNPHWGQGGQGGQPIIVEQRGGNDGMMKGCLGALALCCCLDCLLC